MELLKQIMNFKAKITCWPVHVGYSDSPISMAILQYYLFSAKYSQENKKKKNTNNQLRKNLSNFMTQINN